jgi:hypothetical protein
MHGRQSINDPRALHSLHVHFLPGFIRYVLRGFVGGCPRFAWMGNGCQSRHYRKWSTLMHPTAIAPNLSRRAHTFQILTKIAAMAFVVFPTAIAAAAPTPPAPTASAVISDSQINPTTFQYSIDVTDLATSANTVGTFWFSWVPGEDFMSVSPTSITNPTGWVNTVTNGGATDGFAIQWKSGSTAASITAGQSLTGFSFDSTETPEQIAADSTFYLGTPQLTAFTYDAAPFSDAGDHFLVTFAPAAPPAVPLPSGAWMGFAGLATLFAAAKIKRRFVEKSGA